MGRSVVVIRSALVLAALSGAAAVGVNAAAPRIAGLARAVGSGDPMAPERVVVAAGTGALALALVWLAALTALTLAEQLAHGAASRRAPATGVRRVVLLACGIAIAGSMATPAHADGPASPPDTHPLAGLPLPDRAEDPLPTEPLPAAAQPAQPAGPATAPATHRAPSGVIVRPGDSLWSIAERALAESAPAESALAESTPAATDPLAADVDDAWRRLYLANRSTVGPDPDLILPGTRLVLPDSEGDPR